MLQKMGGGGVRSDTVRTLMTSQPIADVFDVLLKGYSSALNRKVVSSSSPSAIPFPWLSLPWQFCLKQIFVQKIDYL